MSEPRNATHEYHCPGEPAPVSRAVHRARLAAFHPACRDCPHRGDTAGFSPKLAGRLAEVHDSRPSPALFDDEGVFGVLVNELTADASRRAAVAFGLYLREQNEEPRWPTVVLAGDGRRLTHPLTAAAADALRLAGCHVIDAGQATAGCLSFALRQSRADGGLLVGNPGRRPQQAGIRFWLATQPLSRGAGLERIETLFHGGLDRPTRQFGSLCRVSFEADYLDSLAAYYHAVRPLRVVLQTGCTTLVDYLGRLSQSLECRFLHDPATATGIENRILEHRAHFGIATDGDAETCQAFDERGRPIPGERLLRLAARRLVESQEGCATAPAIVLERGTPAETDAAMVALGYRVVGADASRAQMHGAMTAEKALLGGGPGGRFWYRRADHVAADALVTLSLLLGVLSQSDQPLSAVLDEATAAPDKSAR